MTATLRAAMALTLSLQWMQTATSISITAAASLVHFRSEYLQNKNKLHTTTTTMRGPRATVERLDQPSAYFNTRVSFRYTIAPREKLQHLSNTDALPLRRTNAGGSTRTSAMGTTILTCRTTNPRRTPRIIRPSTLATCKRPWCCTGFAGQRN